MIEVRRLNVGEQIPQDLFIGYPSDDLTPSLTWVAVDGDRIVGVMLGLGGHRTLYLMRVVGVPGISPTWLVRLLKFAVKDARARGYNLLMVLLDDDHVGGKLARALGRSGGIQRTQSMTLYGNSMKNFLREGDGVPVKIEREARA